MDASLRVLYAEYIRVVQFYNEVIEKKYASERARALFRQEPISESDFPGWWQAISLDPAIKARWLERFNDPAGYFHRACRRISEDLSRIPIQKVAA